MERVAASEPGRVEVYGRWYGVRGRRFVRPTLILKRADGEGEIRALAELEHKPWTAEDGEMWVAAFPMETELSQASGIELNVAPDISVWLPRSAQTTVTARRPPRPEGTDGRPPGATAPDAAAQPSRPADQPTRRRPVMTEPGDAKRLTDRLAAAGQILERERERRAVTERALEEERSETRRLRTELGQLRAELDLARTAQGQAETSAADLQAAHRRQADDTASELEAAKRELADARERAEQLTRELDQAARAHAEARTALQERTGALEAARHALAAEQAETARMRSRLTAAHDETTRKRAAVTEKRAVPAGETGEAFPAEGAAAGAGGVSRDDETDDRSAPPEPPPTEAFVPLAMAPGHAVLTPDPELIEAAAVSTSSGDAPGRRSSARPSEAPERPEPHLHLSPASRTARAAPAPRRRRRTSWAARLLALIFLLAVIAAVLLVIKSTGISH